MRAFILLLVLLAGVGAVDGTNACFERCKSGSNTVNLYSCGLTDDDLPEVAKCLDDVGRDNIESMYISSNALTTLPADIFQGLGGLVRLLLNSNELSALPPGLFDGLGDLKYLYLMQNQLTTLPDGLFVDLGVLHDLYLYGNPDLQCVPANGATVVRVDDITFDQCECTPTEAVLCDKGLDCVPGVSGYTCEAATHKLGGELSLSEVPSTHTV